MLTGRHIEKNEDARRYAEALYAALCETEDALIMGSIESGDTLIDGYFDLIDLAARTISRLGHL